MTDNKPVRIVRSPHSKDRPYFPFARQTAQDENISYEALGVLTYLLSKPDGWEIDVKDIARRATEYRAYKVLRELRKAGYVTLEKEKGKGKYSQWVYQVYETNLQLVENQLIELQLVENQHTHIIQRRPENTESHTYANASQAIVHVNYAPFDVYCGRGNRSAKLKKSEWFNPFVIGKDGTREECIAQFEKYLLSKERLLRRLYTLRGKVLGCWCKTPGEPDCPCHCDVLLKYRDLPDEEIERLAQIAEQDPIFEAVARFIFNADWHGVDDESVTGHWNAIAGTARSVFRTVYGKFFSEEWTPELRGKCARAIEKFAQEWTQKNLTPPQARAKFGSAFLAYLQKVNGSAPQAASRVKRFDLEKI